MLCPGNQSARPVLQRTVRALFCLAAFASVFILQNPVSDDGSSATLTEDCALFYVADAEGFQADDCGATLQHSVDLARVDLCQYSAGNHPKAPVLTGAVESLRRAYADLSPPLVV